MKNAIRQKAAQIGIVVAVAGAALVAVIAPAGATADVTTDRAAGTDRYATAAAAALGAYPNGAGTVLIASGENFPDALSGAGLAGRRAAPLLLTQRTTLPPATSQAIDTLKATNAVILGGPTAVSPAVEAQLEQQLSGDVSRVQGNNRYATAAAVARAIGTANLGEVNSRPSALIANGELFADALAGGPLSAAGATGQIPILLVTGSGVPAETEAVIDELGITQVLILGGTVAVPTAVETELETMTGNEAVRYAGNDRFGTATAVATAALAAPFSFPGTRVLLANGQNFPDALAGGPLGGVAKAPVLLSPANALPATTDSWLRTNTDKVARITALGGSGAITDATLAAAEAAAENKNPTGSSTTTTTTPATANESISVTPRNNTTQSSGVNSSRTYTVSGLDSTLVYDIALADCTDVRAATENRTGFANENSNNIADGTARAGDASDRTSSGGARISQVNGANTTPTTTSHIDDQAPSNGQITFTVSAPANNAATCVIPVVYVDTNGDEALNGSTASTSIPTESFGRGGAVDFGSSSAGTNIPNSNVKENVDSSNSFRACVITTDSPEREDSQRCTTYPYDSDDTFHIPGDDDASLDEFEEMLSPDDDVSGTYRSGGVSVFNIVSDESPAPPQSVAGGESGSNNDVNLVWSDSTTTTVTKYRVYRAKLGAAGPCPEAIPAGADTLATRPNSQLALETYADPNPPPGDYCYYVTAIDPTGAQSGEEGDESAPARTPNSIKAT